MDVDKVDIDLLYTLYNNEITSPLYAWQIKLILEKISLPMSYSTIVRRVQNLCKKELLLEGYRDRNARTFYLAPKGYNFIKDDIIENEECIDSLEEDIE